MWDPMKRVVPFAAGWIGTLDADQRRYTTVTSVGHDGDSRAYMESEEVTELAKRCGLLQRRRPMRLRDAPPHMAELPCWSEHWRPAGFREGLAVPLVTQDDRHLGVLALHTDTVTQPTAEARDVIGAIAPTITAVLDPMNSLAGLARLVHGATAAVVVNRRGTVAPLPGMATDPLLTRCPGVVPHSGRRSDRPGPPHGVSLPGSGGRRPRALRPGHRPRLSAEHAGRPRRARPDLAPGGSLRADAPGAGRPRPGDRGTRQPRHRRPAVHHRADRRGSPRTHPGEAARADPYRRRGAGDAPWPIHPVPPHRCADWDGRAVTIRAGW